MHSSEIQEIAELMCMLGLSPININP